MSSGGRKGDESTGSRGREEGRSPTTISMNRTALHSRYLSLNSVECECVSGAGYDVLYHGGNGKARKALGEIIGGELARRPHKE